MNMPGQTCSSLRPDRLDWRRRGLILGILLLSAAGTLLHADTTVKTLGGGRLTPNGSDAGFTDGDILQLSQFNTPSGCAVDAVGRVYVADRLNGAVRRLEVAANRSRTLLRNLNQPVAVAVDRLEALYVLTQGDGAIQKLDRGISSVLTRQLSLPTAMAYDGSNHLFVTQQDGTVVQVRLTDGAVSAPVLRGLKNPSGIVVLENGWIAVSETAANLVRIWDPQTGQIALQIGTGLAGFEDGPAVRARFNGPCHLAKAPGGSILVADRANHRVRVIDTDGFVTTLYGVESSQWEGPACTQCDPIILPGWLDGSAEFAEARDPLGVAVASNGTVYTTEVYYHLVREITGGVLAGGQTGDTNIVLVAPVLSPASGYFPMGQVITVVNPNSSSFLPSTVFYTTDGTEPTTNSLRVTMDAGVGTVLWHEKQRDLAALRVKAFLGTNPSPTASGQPAAISEIGVPQDVMAGMGSTAVLPVVLNLRTNDQIKSLQFRIEVTPEASDTPMIPEQLRPLSLSTNDLIYVVTSAEAGGESQFRAAPYAFDRTRGVAITFIGSEAKLSVKDFGVVAMLAVPIPSTAPVGSRYLVSVLSPSGTADAAQDRVPLVAMPPRVLTVSRTKYLVGDTSPALWYNAQPADLASGAMAFGDGVLDNSDLNNVFSAALGNRVPYPFTDLFDAMDAFPEDTTSSAGGDGLIRFLDWQVILLRSLGLDLARWERTWSDGGVRMPSGATQNGAADLPGQVLTATAPGAVWVRQVMLSADQLENVTPGATVDIPIHVEVAAGAELAGLAFRATVEAEGPSPALERAVKFIASPNLPPPTQTSVPNPDTILCGWPLVPSSSFEPPLRGSVLLGYVRVTVPATAQVGHVYTIRFANADGSPDLQTQYDFETKPGAVWVLAPSSRPAERGTSDEWKVQFFGSLTSVDAQSDADPDHDGVPNWLEYLTGTNPTDAQSYLHLQGRHVTGAAQGMALRWLSAPGKKYRIESANSLFSPSWTVLAADLPGDGRQQEWIQTNLTSNPSFYRIRVQP